MSGDPLDPANWLSGSAKSFMALRDAADEPNALGQASFVGSVANPKFTPTTWDDYVGQRALKSRLIVAARSAKARGTRMEHQLLVATGGQGKSTVAALIAQELGVPMVKLSRPVDDWQVRTVVRQIRAGGLLFLDEIQLWTAKQLAPIYQLTEDGQLDGYCGRKELYPLVTVIAATTDPQKLAAPFKSRFATPAFAPYSNAEMTEIVAGMAHRTDVPLSLDEVKVLGRATGGVPRNGRQLVAAARDLMVCDVEGWHTARVILPFAGLDPDGLTADHVRYLMLLASSQRGKAGLSTLAGRLGYAEQQVQSLEWLLLDRGYIELATGGRQITAEGAERAEMTA